MPQHLESCYSTGADIPEAIFYRRHRRSRVRSGKPGLHGGQSLQRRPAKPDLNHMMGVVNGGMCLGTLFEDHSVELTDTEDDISEAPAPQHAGNSLPTRSSEDADLQSEWEVCSELSDVSSFSLISKHSDVSSFSKASEQTDSSWAQVDHDDLPWGQVDYNHSSETATYLACLMKNPGTFEDSRPSPRRQWLTKAAAEKKQQTCDGQGPTHDGACHDDIDQDALRRSWQKKQKGPWSHTAQQKVTTQKARRAAQRHRSTFGAD